MSGSSLSPTPSSSDDIPAWTESRLGERRRLADPASREGNTSEAEREFLGAIEAYKRSSGRMFPTWSEVLEVVRGLGYRQSPQPGTGSSTD